MKTQVYAFQGRVSRLKVAGGVLFLLCSLYVVAFSSAEGHLFYKWLFQPWALPIRCLVAIALTWLTVVYTILFIKSFSRKPLIQIEDDWVEVNALKKGRFSVSKIDYISNANFLRYTVVSDKTKYHLPVVLCQDREWFVERMEELALFVATKRKFDDT